MHLVIHGLSKSDFLPIRHMLSPDGTGIECVFPSTDAEFLDGLQRAPDAVIAGRGAGTSDVLRTMRTLRERNAKIPFVALTDDLDPELRAAAIGDPWSSVVSARDAAAASVHVLRLMAMCRREECVASRHAAQLYDDFLARFTAKVGVVLRDVLVHAASIEERLAGHLTPEELFSGAAIRGDAQRLGRIIEQILEYSRLRSGGFSMTLVPFRASDLAGRVVSALRPVAERKGIIMEIHDASGGAVIHADEYAFIGALTQIVSNAITFSSGGAVAITLAQEDAVLRIDVRDNGKGISDEFLPDIFLPFARETDVYAGATDGIGLGLTLARAWLDRMGIPIEIRSRAGAGTTVTLRIHQTEGGVVSEAIRETDAPGSGNSGTPELEPARLLVVEDDPVTQNFMKLLLERKYTVALASRDTEVYDALAAGQTDLILMDLSLQGEKDGFQLTREIRAMPKYSTIPIIAVTAHAFEEIRIHSIQSGCDDYLAKPVQRDVLFRSIDTHLRRRR